MEWFENYVRARAAFADGADWDAGQVMSEATLSRIWQHHKNAGHKSFAILTAWRQTDRSPAANRQAMSALDHDLRSAGLGYNRLTGYGQEIEQPTGRMKVAKEPSLFVHGMAKTHAMRLGKKYDQDFVVYAGPETSGRVHLVNTTTGESDDLGEFHPRRIGSYWSEVKNRHGKRRAFTDAPTTEQVVFEYTPQTLSEARHLQLVTDKLFPERRVERIA